QLLRGGRVALLDGGQDLGDVGHTGQNTPVAGEPRLKIRRAGRGARLTRDAGPLSVPSVPASDSPRTGAEFQVNFCPGQQKLPPERYKDGNPARRAVPPARPELLAPPDGSAVDSFVRPMLG